MKFSIWVPILAVILLPGCSSRPATHSDISVDEAEKIIASKPDLVIVDVREPSEFTGPAGHIPNAINYPWSSGVLKQNYTELDNSKEILLVCRSGRRSQAAAKFLTEKGYSKIYNMLGGTNQWIKDAKKTEQAKNDQ